MPHKHSDGVKERDDTLVCRLTPKEHKVWENYQNKIWMK